MTTYYIDSDSTLASITSANGDLLLFKSGSRFSAAAIPTSFTYPDNLTIGYYGTGAKPVIDGGVVREDWTLESGSIYKRDYASNTIGNVTEDGEPMTMVAWTTDFATTAALMSAGTFAIQPTTWTVYIWPSSGTPAAHEYIVSESLYGLELTTADTNTFTTLLTLDGIRVEHISRHGIIGRRKGRCTVTNIEGRFIGGYYQESAATRLGNGVEFSRGTDGSTFDGILMEDVFDSGVTSQLYDAAPTVLTDHYWSNLILRRCGLYGVEHSNQANNQTLRNIWTESALIEDVSTDACWSGKRGGSAIGSFQADTWMTGKSRVINTHYADITINRCQYASRFYRCDGVHSLRDVTATTVESAVNKFLAAGNTVRADSPLVVAYKGVTQDGGAPSLTANSGAAYSAASGLRSDIDAVVI